MTHDIAATLQARDIHVEPLADTLNLRWGSGLRTSKANIDLTSFNTYLSTLEGPHAHHVEGYVQGVLRALKEPVRHRSAKWSYEQSAGGMMPELQTESFALGFEAVQGSRPWAQALGGGVLLTTAMVVDQGIKTISQDQVAQWGATDDRMYSAGRSMLFHRTRDHVDEHGFTSKPVHTLKVGDGFDAARCMVIADLLFTHLDEFSMLFGLPHQDILLYTEGRSDQHIQALQEETQRVYKEASYPLSNELFELSKGRPALFKA